MATRYLTSRSMSTLWDLGRDGSVGVVRGCCAYDVIAHEDGDGSIIDGSHPDLQLHGAGGAWRAALHVDVGGVLYTCTVDNLEWTGTQSEQPPHAGGATWSTHAPPTAQSLEGTLGQRSSCCTYLLTCMLQLPCFHQGAACSTYIDVGVHTVYGRHKEAHHTYFSVANLVTCVASHRS